VRAVDVAVAVTVGAVVAAGVRLTGAASSGRAGPVVAYLLAAAGAAALLVRRRWPLAVLGATLAVSVAWFALGYHPVPDTGSYVRNRVINLGALVALYTVTSTGSRRRNLVLGAVVVVLVAAFTAGISGIGFANPLVASAVGWVTSIVLFGEVVRSRREYAAALRERALREERLRIARELHDVVAHSIATINVQAGVAAHVIERRPDDAKQALLAIRQASGQALRELRSILGLLRRGDEADAPRRPEPGLSQLDALVAATRGAGLDVRVEVSGAPRSLPALADLTAYRIVQESLTNVLRHAAARQATVTLAWEPEQLGIEVVDDGRGGPGAGEGGGHGIEGMRERALAVGGRLDAGPVAGGGFRVSGRLPFQEAGT